MSIVTPTRGYTDHAAFDSTTKNVDLSQVPVGSWMILSIQALEQSKSLNTSPLSQGWSALTSGTGFKFGTRRAFLFAKLKTSSDKSVNFQIDTPGRWALVSGSQGSSDIASWVKGLPGNRASGDATINGGVQAGSSYISEAPSISAPAKSLVLSFLYEATTANESDYTSLTGASLWIKPGLGSSTETLVVAYNEPAANVTTEKVSVTYPNPQASNGMGIQIAIPGVGTTTTGLQVKLQDNSSAYLSVIVDGQRVAPDSVKTVHPGFDSVPQMVATPGATWAHRGGSASYPEMSEYAYDQSVIRGYGALEFSAQRSSDGVWFGLHDDTLAVVTGNPSLTQKVNTMTWAQIKAYGNTKNAIPGWPSRPFWRLEEFLEKWSKTHILILDPKGGLSKNAEFLSVCSAFNVSRFIWKYYGVGIAGRPQAALDAGWGGTWGYFYNTDIDSGNFASNANRSEWTMIGMNYTASQSYWDTALALGKPVVGHICPTQADYDMAIAKGANMVQVSGVGVVAPVGKL